MSLYISGPRPNVRLHAHLQYQDLLPSANSQFYPDKRVVSIANTFAFRNKYRDFPALDI